MNDSPGDSTLQIHKGGLGLLIKFRINFLVIISPCFRDEVL